MSIKMYIPKPKEWFIERIGKRVYRDDTGKCCLICDKIVRRGLIVLDKLHAEYLAMIDMDFGAEGIFCNYRDNKLK